MKFDRTSLLRSCLSALPLLCGSVLLPASVVRAEEVSPQTVPDVARYEGPPVRDGDGVLFRFRAPSGAAKVYLAGSFNKFANNKDGKVSDAQFAMTQGKNGMYFMQLPVEAKEQKYKYVTEDVDGKFKWVSDPQVKGTDHSGNTVLDFSKLRSIKDERTLLEVAQGEGGPLRDGDRVLFRFRAPAGTTKVYLAGSFNNFANNKAGAVTDQQFEMTPVSKSVWAKWVLADPKSEKYKYVVMGDGEKTRWQSDPEVKGMDTRGNSVLDIAKIDPIKAP